MATNPYDLAAVRKAAQQKRSVMAAMKARTRELESELQVRDDMGNEVLRILREATGKRDFHSEMEAAEHAARMLAEARRDGARARWYFDPKNSKTVIGLELKWLQETDWLTYYRWANDIDAAMKEAK